MDKNKLIDAETRWRDLQTQAEIFIRAGMVRRGLAMKPAVDAARKTRDEVRGEISRPTPKAPEPCRHPKPLDPMALPVLIHDVCHRLTGVCADVKFVETLDSPEFRAQVHLSSGFGDPYQIRILNRLDQRSIIESALHEIGHIKSHSTGGDGSSEFFANYYADSWIARGNLTALEKYNNCCPECVFVSLIDY